MAPCSLPHPRPPQIVVYHGLTCCLAAVLGGHDGLVYSIAWSPDDLAVVTASADLTARVWHLPPGLLAPPERSPLARARGSSSGAGGAARALCSNGWVGGGGGGWVGGGSGGGAGSGLEVGPAVAEAAAALDGPAAAARLAAAGQGDEEGGGRCVTLQHACFVYAAAPCPAPGLGGGAAVATGGFDGVLRLWNASGAGGLLLHTVQVGRPPAGLTGGREEPAGGGGKPRAGLRSAGRR
jgi:hypothetical protein